jgi:hypothetical protein
VSLKGSDAAKSSLLSPSLMIVNRAKDAAEFLEEVDPGALDPAPPI